MIISRRLARIGKIALIALALGSAALPGPMLTAQAQTATPGATDEAKQKKIIEDREAAYAAAKKVWHHGPEKIALRDQGTVDLPEGFIFVPQPEAGGILKAIGSSDSPRTIGLFYPVADEEDWWARLDFRPEGYVKDEEAKDWKADELLANIKEGTEESNAARIERGFQAIEVTGWVESPKYDAASHRLVWSALVKDKGSATDKGSVNYNTYALGRDGYFSLNLITSADAIAKDKARALTLLSSINYVPGKSYGDFNSSTDHIAEYGIAALIGGVAAKKLGLLALGAAFVLKFAKIIAIAVIAFGAGIARFFGRCKKTS